MEKLETAGSMWRGFHNDRP